MCTERSAQFFMTSKVLGEKSNGCSCEEGKNPTFPDTRISRIRRGLNAITMVSLNASLYFRPYLWMAIHPSEEKYNAAVRADSALHPQKWIAHSLTETDIRKCTPHISMQYTGPISHYLYTSTGRHAIPAYWGSAGSEPMGVCPSHLDLLKPQFPPQDFLRPAEVVCNRPWLLQA